MRIEVLIGNDDPIIYPLKQSKITIGSAENCDIVLNAPGISRKHLVIVSEQDNFFVLDQGSTNGSFINEERLIPGKKVQFTSFFPVRLGDQVLLSLLSDEEESSGIEIPIPPREKTSPQINLNDEPKTSLISLSELHKATTEKLVLQRNQKRVEAKKRIKKVPVKEKKKNNLFPALLVIFVILVGFYNYKSLQEEPLPPDIGKVGEVIKLDDIKSEPKASKEYLISENDVPSKKSIPDFLNSLKCTTDLENFLCDYFPGTRDEGYGVVQSGLTFYVLVDGSWFFEEAKKFSKPPIDDSPKSVENYQKLLKDVAVYLYLLRLSPDIDLTNYKDMNIVIGFFRASDNGKIIERAIALKAEALNKLKDFIFPANLRFTKKEGDAALEVTRNYYRSL